MTCVSRTALTATGQRTADVADGVVNLTFGDSFLIVGHRADLMTDLFSEDAQAKPRSQHALEDARLTLHRERDEPATQLCDLGIIGLGWQAHGLSVHRASGRARQHGNSGAIWGPPGAHLNRFLPISKVLNRPHVTPSRFVQTPKIRPQIGATPAPGARAG